MTIKAPVSDDARQASEQQRLNNRQNLSRLWHLFWLLAKPFFFFAPGAKLHFLWVIFLILLRSAFVVVFSFLSRDFWTALQHKDVESFWRLIRLFTIVLICALPTLVWSDYAQMRLALSWRKWFTEKVLADYFASRNYYQIDQQGSDSIDNPDQRIAQDVDSFTFTSLSFFFKVTRTIIDLFNFSVILFSIYPSLFLILLIYSAFGTAMAILLGRKLINLNFRQLKLEADFRYALIRVRENAESIAFYKGEPREKSETNRRFESAYLNRIDLLIWTRNLAFFTESYTYLVEILPLALIAPLYFQGSIEMGVVSQSSQAFRHILSDLSIIVDEFDRLSAFSAGVDRLGELEQFMYDRFDQEEDKRSSDSSQGGGGTGGEGGASPGGKGRGSGGTENIDDRVAASVFGRDYTLEKFRSLHKRGILRPVNRHAALAAARRRAMENDPFNIIEEDDDAHGLVSDFDNDGYPITTALGDDDTAAEEGFSMSEIETVIIPASSSPSPSRAVGSGSDDDGDDNEEQQHVPVSSSRVDVSHLTLATPDSRRRVLFEDVSFSLEPGHSLLIAGPSGTGKSSLLRAIAGLWVSGRGEIRRPSLDDMFFLPQKPYCPLGTLRQQLVYPRTLAQSTHVSEGDLLDALGDVNLADLPSRMGGLDTSYDWTNVLSLGEQQRLAFARLLIGQPKLAILDECSSALDVTTERKLYERLKRKGIAFISVGHRPTLLQYHDNILRLGGRLGRSFIFERIGDPATQEM